MDTISFYSPNVSGNGASEVVRDIQGHMASRGQTRVRSWGWVFMPRSGKEEFEHVDPFS